MIPVSENAFTNNRLSLTLLSSNPVSSTILLDTYECLKGANALPESMIIPEYAESETPNKSAFTYAVRDENINGGLFEWYKRHVSFPNCCSSKSYYSYTC